MIGHGGHSTTARALSAGIPVLVLPMHPLMDQPEVGRAVSRLGAGLTLSKSASSVKIRAAVKELLKDKSFRVAARQIGEQSRAKDGALVAVNVISRVLKNSPGESASTSLRAATIDHGDD